MQCLLAAVASELLPLQPQITVPNLQTEDELTQISIPNFGKVLDTNIAIFNAFCTEKIILQQFMLI